MMADAFIDTHGRLTDINGRRFVWRDGSGFLHLCEGSDAHPGVRLIWTRCHGFDVPANGAWLKRPEVDHVTCQQCLEVEKPASKPPRAIRPQSLARERYESAYAQRQAIRR